LTKIYLHIETSKNKKSELIMPVRLKNHEHFYVTLKSSNFKSVFEKKKRSLNKNSKGLLPPPKQKISTNYAKNAIISKKGYDAEGPPIALGAPNLEGPRGIFPTSLYGQSAPVCGTRIH
jgi:hypothetical protein